jgi:hypothetical protein
MTVYTIFASVGIAAFVLALIRFVVKRPPNVLITFVQDFVGCFFIFSGFVKSVDPLGTSYKMREYFEAFSGEKFYCLSAAMNAKIASLWDFCATLSTPVAIIMIAAELFFGLMLIIGWRPKLTVTVIWLLTLFFTFLTGYTYLSAYTITHKFIFASAIVIFLFAAAPFMRTRQKRNNLIFFSVGLLLLVFLLSKFSGFFVTAGFDNSNMKVTDCGCFGDFIKLKPWQTFYKDCVLDVLILILVMNIKLVRADFKTYILNIIAAVFATATILFCLYNVYLNKPVLDFRPYAIGQDINENMTEKRAPIIKMTLVYRDRATKQLKEFPSAALSDTNQMKEIANMDFVKRRDEVLDEGIPAKISNLYIQDDDGNNMNDSIFHNPDYSLMVVVYNLAGTHTSAFKQLNDIAGGCDKIHVKFFVVTVNDGHIEDFRNKYQTAYPFYYADDTPLKTIIRSNPGLVLLKNGVIINKWHYLHFPTFDELNKEYFSKR